MSDALIELTSRVVTVPVTLGFDDLTPIGTMTIDATKLPQDGKFCFAIGLLVNKHHFEGDKIVYDRIELVHVALQSDEKYREFLNGPTA